MERLGDDRNLRGSNHGTEMKREAPQSQVDLGATPTYEIELIGKEGSMKARAKKKASKNGKGEEPSAQTSQWSEDGWDWPQHSNQKSNQWSQNPQDSGEQADSSWTRCDEEIGWTRSNVSDEDVRSKMYPMTPMRSTGQTRGHGTQSGVKLEIWPAIGGRCG